MKPSKQYKEKLGHLNHLQLLELAKKQGNEAIYMEFVSDLDFEVLSEKLNVMDKYEKYSGQFSIIIRQNSQETADLMTDYSNFLLEKICLPNLEE